jgi:Ca2+-dependent lipid-binding protein
MVGSILTATIVEARDLKTTRITGIKPYIVLSTEGQRTQTEAQYNADPVWNEIMSFDISTGKDLLVVKVYDHPDIGSDILLGEC